MLRRTFLFTDVEGSYRQWERHPEAMPRALAEHDAILQQAIGAQGGRIFKTIGDAVCAVFDTPIDGVRAAVAAQHALFTTDWNTLGLAKPLTARMALQSGEAQERDGDFTGLVLNRISRLLRAGHGGQVLLSRAVADEVERQPMGGVGLRDLGERRLRDVPGAHRIYQLEIDGLPTVFPPLETLDAIAHNLPVSLNTCLDRETELGQLRHTLLDSPTRLVTLLGPGGIGKTRLALHAAAQLIDAFPGGVWFVDLSGIRDATLMPTAVASALGVRGDPGGDPLANIAAEIGERELLLILDNCEQIVDGVARFLVSLLGRTRGPRVLATSRIPLELRGEQRIEVGPLPVEEDDVAGPAVRLFLERAQQIRPGFAMTAANQESVFEICRRVDGIPLALELAAARVAVLSPEALRARLSSRLTLLISTSRDLPERHQTLRAAIEWSYALLHQEEQAAFRALSVFRGGWTLTGAQTVAGLDELATMEILGSLRDKSLIRLSETNDAEPRYSMLETIQEYGMELLAESDGLDSARAAQAGFVLDLSGEAARFIERGPNQHYWLALLDRELANVRAGLQWCLDAGQAEQAIDLCLNLWYYWSTRGLTDEGQRWFEQSLALAANIDPLLRSKAMCNLGNLCIERGEPMAAEALYRAALAIDRAAGNDIGVAQSLSALGMVAGIQGRTEEEHDLQVEALALCRRLEHKRGTASSLLNLAIWARNTGQAQEALALLGEVAELLLELRDEIGLGFVPIYVARVREDLGELDEAAALLESAEQFFAGLENSEGLSFARLGLASVESRRGNLARAEVLIEDALSGYRLRGDQVELAVVLETLASICVRTDAGARGTEAMGAAHHLRQLTNAVAAPIDAPALTATRQALEENLGALQFARHWEQGRQAQIRAAWSDVAPSSLLPLISQSPPA